MRAFLESFVDMCLRAVLWLGGIIGVIIAFFEWFTKLVIDLTVWAYGEISSFNGPSFEFNLADHASTLALANHFLPVAEAWAFVVVSVPYMLFVVILRFVKSWIPTMAN